MSLQTLSQLFCTNSSGHRNGALRFHLLPFYSAVRKTNENGVGGKSRVPYQSISCQQPPPLRTAGQPQPQCTATTQQLPTATISPCFHSLCYCCAVIPQAIIYLVIFSWYYSETVQKKSMIAYSKENGAEIWLEPAAMQVLLLTSVHDVWGESFSMPLLLSVWQQHPCCSWSTFSSSLRWPCLGSDPAATHNSSDEQTTAQRLYYNNVSRARDSSNEQMTGQRFHHSKVSTAHDSSEEHMTGQRFHHSKVSTTHDSSEEHMIGQRFHHSEVSTAHDSSDEHMTGQRFHHSKVSTAHDKKGEWVLGD